MPRLTPVHWETLKCIFEKAGFTHKRTEGSYLVFEKEGVNRPIIIPKYDEIGLDIIKSCMRTAGMSRDEYLKLLEECK